MGCMRYLNVRHVWNLLYGSGISAAIGRRYAGIGAIFTFHHVVPDVSTHLNGNLYVSAGFLDTWLTSLHKAGVKVISMNDAVKRIREPGLHSPRRRFVVMTFDDGYADNIAHALPILEKWNAPFSIHVTTDMIERSGYLWWLGLERLLQTHNMVDVTPMKRRFTTSSLQEKANALAEVTHWVGADVGQRAPLLRDVFNRYGVSVSAATNEAGLSRDQLRALGRHPLATIGGHTTTHSDLTRLGEAEAYREMSDNKAFLEDILGIPVEHFAYPYGACGEREATLAAKAGFRTAVTVRTGCLFPEHRDNFLLLPRCVGKGSRMWLSFMHAQRHGVQRFIASRGGCPVVTL